MKKDSCFTVSDALFDESDPFFPGEIHEKNQIRLGRHAFTIEIGAIRGLEWASNGGVLGDGHAW